MICEEFIPMMKCCHARKHSRIWVGIQGAWVTKSKLEGGLKWWLFVARNTVLSRHRICKPGDDSAVALFRMQFKHTFLSGSSNDGNQYRAPVGEVKVVSAIRGDSPSIRDLFRFNLKNISENHQPSLKQSISVPIRCTVETNLNYQFISEK